MLTCLRQGDGLSPTLFNFALEKIIRKTFRENFEGIQVEGKNLAYLAYADDISLLSSSQEELRQMTRALKAAANKFGLIVNETKTEYLNMTRGQGHVFGQLQSLRVGDQSYKRVHEFKYLGSLFTENSSCEAEINARTQQETELSTA